MNIIEVHLHITVDHWHFSLH